MMFLLKQEDFIPLCVKFSHCFCTDLRLACIDCMFNSLVRMGYPEVQTGKHSVQLLS